MAEYTQPDLKPTARIRDLFVFATAWNMSSDKPFYIHRMHETAGREWDRWIATHDRAVKADLLRTMAGEADRKSAERAAISRENYVRCSDCNLRFGESDQYSCVIEGTGHRYFEDELTRAREVRIEPTYDGNQLRARADELDGDRG